MVEQGNPTEISEIENKAASPSFKEVLMDIASKSLAKIQEVYQNVKRFTENESYTPHRKFLLMLVLGSILVGSLTLVPHIVETNAQEPVETVVDCKQATECPGVLVGLNSVYVYDNTEPNAVSFRIDDGSWTDLERVEPSQGDAWVWQQILPNPITGTVEVSHTGEIFTGYSYGQEPTLPPDYEALSPGIWTINPKSALEGLKGSGEGLSVPGNAILDGVLGFSSLDYSAGLPIEGAGEEDYRYAYSVVRGQYGFRYYTHWIGSAPNQLVTSNTESWFFAVWSGPFNEQLAVPPEYEAYSWTTHSGQERQVCYQSQETGELLLYLTSPGLPWERFGLEVDEESGIFNGSQLPFTATLVAQSGFTNVVPVNGEIYPSSDIFFGLEGDRDEDYMLVEAQFEPQHECGVTCKRAMRPMISGGVSQCHTGPYVPPPVVYPIDSVEITGPVSGTVGLTYTFVSETSPLTATVPIVYQWSDGQSTKEVTQAWSSTGVYTIEVRVDNPANRPQTDVHTITISATEPDPALIYYLPLVTR